MSSISSKITRHTKKQRNMTYNQGKKKKQSIETDPEITEMKELADKNVNRAIINVF